MEATVAELAREVGGDVIGDGARLITGLRSLEEAGPHDVTFALDERNLRKLTATGAAAVLVGPLPGAQHSIRTAASPTLIVVGQPVHGLLRLLELFLPRRPRPMIGISAAAHVSPTARIGAYTNVHPGVHVGDEAVVGDHCDLHPGVVVEAGCRIGDHVVLHPNVVVYRDVTIGSHVSIHASSVIGADGFGYRLIDGRHVRLPHTGTVRIEDDVEIGACSTIDRALIGETVIGTGTRIDNLVVVAHNCRLGRHNLLVSQVGLAGSVTTGDYVVFAGQAGIADHVHLGDRAVIGSKAGVHNSLPGDQTYLGAPALPVAEARRVIAAQNKLPQWRQKLKDLDRRMGELSSRLDSVEGRTSRNKDAA